jgi:hypothetical protein
MSKDKKYSKWEYEEEQEEKQGEESDEEKLQRESAEAQAAKEAEEAAKKTAELDNAEVEVDIDGKKEKFTVAELKKGYLRQADYTKKTQELSEMSKKEKEAAVEKAKKVVENPEEFPDADVKAAEYLIKIAKKKFGLMTRDEYEAEEGKKKAVSEFQSKLDSASSEIKKMKGMPEFNEDEIINHMQKTGIHNPLAAYKDLHEAAYIDFKIKLAKGDKGYHSEKKGEKIEPKKDEFNVRTDKGHRDYLMEELGKMKE